MKLGYHHHTPVAIDSAGTAKLPAHAAMFVNELARQAGHVTFFAFDAPTTGMEDAPLDSSLVSVVSLGRKPADPVLTFGPRRALVRNLDALLVRGPGPLVPRFLRLREPAVRAALMVGSWRSWRANPANSRVRNVAIAAYHALYDVAEIRALRSALVLTNNPWLSSELERRGCPDVRTVFTSSISVPPIPRDRTMPSEPRLLFTGRIVEEKGVFEIVSALALLRERGVAASLRIVGWSPKGDPAARRLLDLAERHGIGDAVTIDDYEAAGDGLARAYEDADVFVSASRTEWGMPHTIVEAMAHGLPVVTTNFEGGRGLLDDRAIVVPARDVTALADGIERVVKDPSIGARGRAWAGGLTNEASVAAILEHIGGRVGAAR